MISPNRSRLGEYSLILVLLLPVVAAFLNVLSDCLFHLFKLFRPSNSSSDRQNESARPDGRISSETTGATGIKHMRNNSMLFIAGAPAQIFATFGSAIRGLHRWLFIG